MRSLPAQRARRLAFTLVELMVTLSIIGVLMSLLLVGVQSSRDSARRMTCANNLRNQVLALQGFHAARQRFPAGRQYTSPTIEYSWCFELLPYLEQTALFDKFDRSKPWSDPGGNGSLADTNLRIFRCPSGLLKFDGKIDYGGLTGTWLADIATTGLDNGVLVEVGRVRPDSIRLADITDGASHTVAVAESTDCKDRGGRWVSGFNCFSHDNGSVSDEKGNDIFSYHVGGAYLALADGSVKFAPKQMAEAVIGALCTRNGGETINDF